MSKPLLTSTQYDVLKRTVSIGLPALSTLYFTLAQIYGWSNAEQVVGTIAAINTFLGILMGYSTRTYNSSDSKYAGDLTIEKKADGSLYSLNLNGAPEELADKPEVVFKVVNS
jgi:hypothetical protein